MGGHGDGKATKEWNPFWPRLRSDVLAGWLANPVTGGTPRGCGGLWSVTSSYLLSTMDGLARALVSHLWNGDINSSHCGEIDNMWRVV